MKKTLCSVLSVLMVLFCLCSCGKTETTVDNGGAGSETNSAADAQNQTAAKIGIHHAEIVIKDYGTIKLELDGDTAPITVQNFIDLAKDGFYDGLTFHRIMTGFMMQGGSSDGLGYEGSDTCIKGEFASNGVNNPIKHVRGTISMARANDYNSGSSQFFICHQTSPSVINLDGDYAAFGHVTEGLDVVDKVCTDAKPVDNNGTIPADRQPVIEKITITD